jgi:AbrB family looped-hinge helix DNA binding protein
MARNSESINRGRIVVPKLLRERLGLKPDGELEVLEQAGGVLLLPVEQRPSMIKIDGLWVHQGVAQPANWERVVQDVREERITCRKRLAAF